MPPTRTEVFVKATQEGFDRVGKSIDDLGAKLQKALGKTPPGITRMTAEIDKLKSSMEVLSKKMGDFVEASKKQKDSIGVFKNMEWSIASIVRDVEKLIQIQMRWYGTRFIIDTITQATIGVARETLKYADVIEVARGEMLRWAASSGKLSLDIIGDTEGILRAVRRATTEYPVLFEDLSKSTQAFLGAGIAYKTVMEMVPDIAKLRTAFPEIQFETFAIALAGAFNVFKDSIKGAETEAQKFKVILDSLTAAQARGIIRPEQFTKVLQYLGQVSELAGFSLQQMLALSVAVTDTGIQAASASRLLSGMMMSFQRREARITLKKYFDIDIQRNIPIADQLFDILEKIKKTVGEKVTPGWMEVFQKFIPSDRMRVFLTLLEKIDEYKKVLETISGAVGGGLDLAANVMRLAPTQQFAMFLSVLKEITKAIGKDLGQALKEVAGFVLDVSRGILVAVDTTGLYADKVGVLGTAGKVAYDIFKDFSILFTSFTTVLESAFTVVSTSLSGLFQLLGVLSQMKELLALIVDYYIARLVVMIAVSLITSLSNLIIKVGLAVKEFWGLHVVLTTLGIKMEGAAVAMSRWAAGPFIVLAIAIEGINFLFRQLNANLDRMSDFDAKLEGMLRGATAKNIGSIIEQMGKMRGDISRKIEEAEEEERLIPGAGRGRSEELRERLKSLEYFISRAKVLQKELGKRRERPNGLGEPSPETEKSLGQQLAEVLRSTDQVRLNILEESHKTELNALKEKQKMGLISEKEYDDKVIEFSKTLLDEKLKIIDNERKEVDKNYKKALGDAKGEKAKIDLIEQKRALSIFRIDLQQKRATEEQKRTVDDITTKRYLENMASWLRSSEQSYKEDIFQSSIRREKLIFDSNEILKQIEYLYSKARVSASAYYDMLFKNITTEYKETERALNEEFKLYERNWLDRVTAAGQNQAEIDRLDLEYTDRYRKYQEDKLKASQQFDSKVAEAQRKQAEDFKSIWEKAGVKGVWGKTLEDMRGDFFDWGKQLNSLFKETTNELANTFKTAFIDIAEGNLKSLWDYFNSFLKAVRNAMFQILAQQAAIATLGAATAGGNVIWSWLKSSGTPGATPKPSEAAKISVHRGGLIPSFHLGGLTGDERIAKVLTNERILSREQNVMFENMYSKVMGGAGGGDVEVHIYNQSRQPLTATVSKPIIEGNKMIISALLKDIESYGPSYHAIKNVR